MNRECSELEKEIAKDIAYFLIERNIKSIGYKQFKKIYPIKVGTFRNGMKILHHYGFIDRWNGKTSKWIISNRKGLEKFVGGNHGE